MTTLYKLLLALILVLKSFDALAFDYKHCISAVDFYEDKYNLPKNLLHSITITESGRWDEQSKKLMPSPWTLNVEGKPYYFNNREDALRFFKKMLASGIESIDVGCAQVNWYHHGKHYFSSPEDAINPALNIKYAARLLSKNYIETNNWTKAVAIYHSRNAARGNNYASKVVSRWKKYDSKNNILFEKVKKRRTAPQLFQNRSPVKYPSESVIVLYDTNKISNTTIIP